MSVIKQYVSHDPQTQDEQAQEFLRAVENFKSGEPCPTCGEPTERTFVGFEGEHYFDTCKQGHVTPEPIQVEILDLPRDIGWNNMTEQEQEQFYASIDGTIF